MLRLQKVKAGIAIVFVSISVLTYQLSYYYYNSYVAAIYEKSSNTLEANYNASLNLYRVTADSIYNTLIKQENVLSLIAEAKRSKQNRAQLREKLYKDLRPHYQALSKEGLNIMLITFENNDVFLRVHKPSKYGDSIEKIRKTIVHVNEEKNSVLRGFEQGKISHAFRNVYPLYYKGEYLGSIDIAFSSESMQQYISEITKVYTHFLVKRSLFETKIWKEDRNTVYSDSKEHPEYLYTKRKYNTNMQYDKLSGQFAKVAQKEIVQNMTQGKRFSLYHSVDGHIIVASFLPITNYAKERVDAYLVSYIHSKEIDAIESGFYLINFVVNLVVLLLALAVYKIFKRNISLKDEVAHKTEAINEQKEELEKLVHSFDKHVIFSRTDLRGVITHASEAFCKISGYSAEELLGKHHNIVRHEDMDPKTFEAMWRALKEKGFWSGDVKNRRKDGSFYWVFSRIEKEYDNDGNPLGYYAVREDITLKKEVEKLKEELESFNQDLEGQVKERTQEVVALNKEIQETQKEVVFTMGAIGESRSKETGEHVRRVAEYSKLLALLWGMDEESAELLKQASPMHDIGKVAIPDAILNKPGRLNDAERELMNTHAQLGYEMLKHSSRPLLKIAATVAYEHHEKWDGSGYPNKLAGEEISIYGRISAIADVFDALGSDRVYKKAWELEKILELFKEERGKHFDPKLIDLFFANLDKFLEIRDRYKD